MTTLITILILITVVAISDVIYRQLPIKIPLPILQIILGALIAWPDVGLYVEFNPELFLILFIPPLLFADGRKMPLNEFLEHKHEVISLAMTLVFITVIGLGHLIHYIIPEMPLIVAFALAAVLSPTDAVALTGIVGKGRLPKMMTQILEGEALMNDASALVSLKFAIAIAMGTMTLETTNDYIIASLIFIKMSIGGILTGLAVTWVYVRMVRLFSDMRDDDPASQMIFFMLVPFIAYASAEHLSTSGILAAVASGMMVGHSNVINAAPITMRLRANSVWMVLEFIFNGIVFLLVGLQIPGIVQTSFIQVQNDNNMTFFVLIFDILWIYLALMMVRFLWLLTMRSYTRFIRKSTSYFGVLSIKELLVMTFAGVRGAITLAAALSIPLMLNTSPAQPFPNRYQVIFLAVGVILISLFASVVLLPVLLKGFTLDRSVLDKEKKIARNAMSKSALESLEILEARILQNNVHNIDPDVVHSIHGQVASDIQRAMTPAEEIESYEPLEIRFRIAALRAQRGELYRLKASKQFNEETISKLLYEVDLLETVLLGREKD